MVASGEWSTDDHPSDRAGLMPLRVAVIADSHFHPAGLPRAEWASDRLFNARNAVAVAMVERARPDLVIHLGDVVHPIPGLPEHATALAEARATYGSLTVPLHVVPGNHDVGDKPHPWAPAPSVSDEKHATFSTWWGPPWWCVERDGVRLLAVDTPVLNSGLLLEEQQWAWLEETLRPGGPRTFVFLHYPLFLLRPDEPEHYDNVAEPARSRLLGLFARAGVEAVLCGHVHHPFWNLHRGTDHYLLPSTAFVRPGYAELGRIGPGGEFGRDDADRLGFCLLDIDDRGHRVSWIRTDGATEDHERRVPEPPPACPLGLTLRHAWDAVHDLAADGLEPFRRKRARNDLVLLAVLELGATLLRVPFDDLRSPETRERMVGLARWGLRFVLFGADPLTAEDRALVAAHADLIAAVELVVHRARLGDPLPDLPVPRWVSALGRAPAETGSHTHFAPTGFLPEESPDVAAEGVVVRIEPDVDPRVVVPALGASRIALVVLPRAGESRCFDDDQAVELRVRQAYLAAVENPGTTVILDTTVDHDRGYFPRHALLDRRGNPRRAFHSLVRWSRAAR